ncbi:MAG: DUF4105 domain-containing protein [Treponema sp.]|nr:DUF4105 domain-containing protein [Treponema sp.]
MKSRRLFFLICFAVLSCTGLFAQEGEEGRGDYLTLKIAVMGPGDELYFWWGHIALVIEDAVSGQNRFYDYGVFDFRQDNFFVNFVFGRLVYHCAATAAEDNYGIYRAANRDITLYTLDLPAAAKEEIRLSAERNVLPENRNYYYHHFDDNCATRIRDIIDMAVGGAFKETFGEAPGRYTLRQHVRRHTWFSPFYDWILNFLMGQVIDRPITVWDEMFLPSEIGRRIERFSYAGSAGTERKLVARVEILNRAVNRPAALDVPRRQWPRELVFSAGLSLVLLLFMGMRSRARTARAGRVLLGLSQSCLGVFFGLAGSVLFFMSFFTNHDYTYQNSNLLYVNPLLLAAVPLGCISLSKKPRRRFAAEQFLKSLWTYVFLGGMLSMVIKLFPGFYQQNQVDQALTLPVAFALSFFPRWIGRMFPRSRRPAVGREGAEGA